jgi:hypothetical protein
MSYSYSSGGKATYSYRGGDPDSGCIAQDSFTGFASNCLETYSVGSNGSPSELIDQIGGFDPRLQPWWTSAQIKGTATWSTPYDYVIDGVHVPILAYAYPVYSSETNAFLAMSVVEYKATDCKYLMSLVCNLENHSIM